MKAQVRGNLPKPLIWGGMPLTLPPSLGTRSIDNPEIELAALQTPSVREADPGEPQPPADPAIAALRAIIREQLQALAPPKSAVEEAKTYLVKTATPGYTMTRQSPEVAIDRLHPGFAVKLAQAIRRAREEGMTQAGVFSAYRPPAFGIGGFRNKFNSLHSYGLATDITGIGRPGSETAHRWQEIVQEVGLIFPTAPTTGSSSTTRSSSPHGLRRGNCATPSRRMGPRTCARCGWPRASTPMCPKPRRSQSRARPLSPRQPTQPRPSRQGRNKPSGYGGVSRRQAAP